MVLGFKAKKRKVKIYRVSWAKVLGNLAVTRLCKKIYTAVQLTRACVCVCGECEMYIWFDLNSPKFFLHLTHTHTDQSKRHTRPPARNASLSRWANARKLHRLLLFAKWPCSNRVKFIQSLHRKSDRRQSLTVYGRSPHIKRTWICFELTVSSNTHARQNKSWHSPH